MTLWSGYFYNRVLNEREGKSLPRPMVCWNNNINVLRQFTVLTPVHTSARVYGDEIKYKILLFPVYYVFILKQASQVN